MLIDGPVLAMGAHPDDIELGCGGTIARLVREGIQVVGLTFADCSSTNPGADLKEEAELASHVLGFKLVGQMGIPVRQLQSHRDEIAAMMVRLDAEFRPALVLTHCAADIHQDHATVALEAERIFRRRTVLAFENAWSANIAPNLRIALEDADVDRKLLALAAYRSQARRHYFGERVVRAQLALRGSQIDTTWAEGFVLVRGVVR